METTVRSLAVRIALAAAACLSYMGLASGLILLNKYILSTDGFKYPMALSALGMGFSGVASLICCKMFKLDGEPIPFMELLQRFMPVGLFMAMSLFTGNLVYLYLTVSFIQMLKALSPAVTMLVLFGFKLEKPTMPLICSVLIITTGIGISSLGEVNFVVLGVMVMLVSIVADAFRLVLIQYLLSNRSLHPLEALMYLAPACTIWLVGGMLVSEWPTMMQENALLKMAAKPWLYLAAAGMGFAVNGVCYVAIKLTSSLTIKVASAAKDTTVVLFGVLVLEEAVTEMQGFGYGLALLGFGFYNYIKYREAEAARPEYSQPTPDMKLGDVEKAADAAKQQLVKQQSANQAKQPFKVKVKVDPSPEKGSLEEKQALLADVAEEGSGMLVAANFGSNPDSARVRRNTEAVS